MAGGGQNVQPSSFPCGCLQSSLQALVHCWQEQPSAGQENRKEKEGGEEGEKGKKREEKTDKHPGRQLRLAFVLKFKVGAPG